MDTLIQWGMPIVQWIQTLRSPVLDLVMGATYYLGSEDFFILFLPLVFWCIHKSLGIRLSLVLIFSNFFNQACKDFFAAPRPWQIDDRLYAPFKTTGFGIPSGHSQATVTFWGYIAAQLKTRGWWFLAVILSLWVGIGRIYVGDHFPQDVLLGWTLGAVIVAVSAVLQAPLTAWIRKLSPAVQIGLGIVVPLVVFGLHATGDTAKMMGILLGFLALLPIEERTVRFDVRTTRLRQIVKFTLGVIVILALRIGLKALLPEQILFDFIRYAAMGAWASLGAPWFFVKTGLATTMSRP